MKIGILGNGAFGSAIAHILKSNGHEPESVDVGEKFTSQLDILIIAAPTQVIRQALVEHNYAFSKDTLFVNCAKGIEKGSGKLPRQVVNEVTGTERYAVLGGPSFASEIKNNIPTVVNIATTKQTDEKILKEIFENDTFVVEVIDEIVGLELAGAMKNIYAVAAGYVAGSGGGENTLAHLQVVALREYTKLVHALEGDNDVVRPAVVGDLILTCASKASRNYQYGLALATDGDLPQTTAEGVHTAEAIAVLAKYHKLDLALASAVLGLVEKTPTAHQQLYQALGFSN